MNTKCFMKLRVTLGKARHANPSLYFSNFIYVLWKQVPEWFLVCKYKYKKIDTCHTPNSLLRP